MGLYRVVWGLYRGLPTLVYMGGFPKLGVQGLYKDHGKENGSYYLRV